MANKVQLKAAGDHNFTDSDPFSELTRIMGFDPRVQPTPRPDEDFEIDLEKELMGMFDPGPGAPDEPASARDYPQETADNFQEKNDPADEEIGDAFAANLEEELSDGKTFRDEPAMAEPEPRTVSSEALDDFMADVDMDFDAPRSGDAPQAGGPSAGADIEENDVPAGEAVQAVAADEWNVYRPPFFVAGHAGPTETENVAAADEAGSAEAPVFDIRSFKSAAQQYREARSPHEAPFAESQEIPFADESDAGMSAEMPEAGQAVPRAKAVDPFDILAALGSERGLPQRRDPMKIKPVEPEQPAVAETAAWTEDTASAPADFAPQAHEEALAPAESFAVEENRDAAPMDPAEAEAPQTASVEMRDMPFFDIRPAETAEYGMEGHAEEDHAAAGEAWQDGDAADAAGAPALRGAEIPEIETTEIAEPAVAISDDLDIPVPAFLTEVRAAPAYDELDEEFEQAFQTLSLGAEAIRQVASDPQQPRATETSADIERLFAEELGIGSGAAMAASAASAGNSAAADHSPREAVEAFEFDDSDFLPDEFAADASREIREAFAAEDAEAKSYAPPSARFPMGRGKLVAAAVAGVVVLGGIGAFVLSDDGGVTAGNPVVLKADADPVKVKPKHPGGMTVPNQDNKVYERVADGATAVAPEQKKLVSTEEKPVDIANRTQNAATALPGVFDGDKIASLKTDPAPEGAGDSAASAAASKGDIVGIIETAPEQPAAKPKGEERLSPSQETTPARADKDVLAVTPHKVRTMIVRADGTMVPREEPAPAADAAEAGSAAPADLPAAAPIPTAEPRMAAAAETAKTPAAAPKAFERTDRGQINTPSKVAAAPTRPADQPVDVVGAKPQQVASAEAAPVRAASGDWSVQIASQPTVEAAQTTYQNMARRYAEVLGGHAANIVKADIAGKGTYYRVRIAAGSKDDAVALCSRLKTAGGSCFVSK